jgi:molecular chaperone DnaK (HSP70)
MEEDMKRKTSGAIQYISALGMACLMSCGGTALSSAVFLKKPIGIMTSVGFSEMIRAGESLPRTYSESFGNAEGNQTRIRVTIVQRDASGDETIVVADIDDLPARPKGKLNVIVTITVDTNKQLRLKATVPETGYLKQFGPFAVI